MSYTPPDGTKVSFNLSGAYTPPTTLGFNFTSGSGGGTSTTQYVYPTPVDDGAFGSVTAANLTRYIPPFGIAPGSFGAPTLTLSAQGIFPTGSNASAVGAATISNWVRTVLPSGINGFASGTAALNNLNRHFTLTGFDSSAFGTTMVSNSQREVDAAGADMSAFGVAGVANRNRAFALTGFDASAFGTASVVMLRRYIGATGFLGDGYGKPFLTPFKIAVSPADSGEMFGSIVADLATRYVSATGSDMSGFGTASLDLGTRYVSPTGIAADFRTYAHVSTPSPQTIMPFWGVFSALGNAPPPTLYGNPSIGPAPPPPDPFGLLRVAGIAAGDFGVHDVESTIRYLTVAGMAGDFGIPAVHPPLTAAPDGIAPGAFGALVTGYRVRTVFVDSSDLDTHWGPELGDGFSPMRVRRKLPPLQPTGIAPGPFGATYIGLFEQPVAASIGDGALFGAPKVAGRSALAPAGFDSMVLGTPKQPVFGQLEPAGEDECLFGRGMINRAIYPAYIEPGLVPAPRVRSIIQPLGMECEFGDTVVVGESNCGSTLAIVAVMGDLSTFGQPGVQ